MAGIEDVEEAWERLTRAHGETVVPVTYMNSSAALKAFCGEHGGVVCTSSNARTVLEWAWERKRRVFFFPDQHLGRNTGFAMGVPLEHMAEWDYRAEDPARSRRFGPRPARPVAGSAGAHRFTPRQVEERRPGIGRGCCPRSARSTWCVRPTSLTEFIQQVRAAGTHGRSAPRSTSCTGWRWSTRSR
jgi:hypothetical protein